MTKLFSYKNDLSPLLKLAIPLALTGVVQSSTYFFETLFLAHLGKEVLAAGSLVGWLFATIAVILFGTLSSINILVSHKFGEKDEKGIAFVARDGLWLSVLFSIAIFALCWNMAPVFLFFGQPESVVLQAETYLHALAWGIPPSFVMIAIYECIVGVGRARPVMLFSCFNVIMTIVLSYALIFGKLGAPKLGIAGAGWGIAISNIVTVIALILYLLLQQNMQRYFHSLFRFTSPLYMREIIVLGVPIGLMYCVEVGFFFALSLVMGTLGTVQLAANQIGLQYMGFLMAVIFSIAQAITVRMGHLIGAKEYHAVEVAAFLGASISGILMLLIAIVFWTTPLTLISIDFNIHDPNNATLLTLTQSILLIAPFFQILEAVRISLFGALRACKDTHFTLLVSIVSFWCIALPLGYYFAKVWGMGGVGMWWGMILGVSTSLILLYARLRYRMRHYQSLSL